jgi:hypothetical protein
MRCGRGAGKAEARKRCVWTWMMGVFTNQSTRIGGKKPTVSSTIAGCQYILGRSMKDEAIVEGKVFRWAGELLKKSSRICVSEREEGSRLVVVKIVSEAGGRLKGRVNKRR